MAIKNVKMILKKTRDKTQKCINALHQWNSYQLSSSLHTTSGRPVMMGSWFHLTVCAVFFCSSWCSRDSLTVWISCLDSLSLGTPPRARAWSSADKSQTGTWNTVLSWDWVPSLETDSLDTVDVSGLISGELFVRMVLAWQNGFLAWYWVQWSQELFSGWMQQPLLGLLCTPFQHFLHSLCTAYDRPWSFSWDLHSMRFAAAMFCIHGET